MIYKKILIAVDASEYSMQAAHKGLELARQLQAEVALLFVIDLAKATGNIDAGMFAQEALVVLKKEAEQTLDELATMYAGGSVLKFMPTGHPAHDIIKTAATWAADLIVVGTHGRTGLMHLLVGSVAEHVVRHSPVPVLVVPAR